MISADFISAAIDWIEAHEHTVDLLKWIVAGIVAWALGVFRAIRAWASRPSISVGEKYSHCFIEHHSELGPHNDTNLIVLVLDAIVMNPTNLHFGVHTFELQLRRRGLWRRWTTTATAIGFPTMPRTPMPNDAIKVVPVWLSTFEEFDDSLSLKGVPARDSAAGLVFFALAAPDKLFPHDGECTVKLSVKFATGEKRSVVTTLRTTNDFTKLERMIPSSAKFVKDASVWTYHQ